MGTPGDILSTVKTQTSHRDESLPNVSTRTNKRKDSDNSLGIIYCCFDILEICNMLEFQTDKFVFNNDSY